MMCYYFNVHFQGQRVNGIKIIVGRRCEVEYSSAGSVRLEAAEVLFVKLITLFVNHNVALPLLQNGYFECLFLKYFCTVVSAATSDPMVNQLTTSSRINYLV